MIHVYYLYDNITKYVIGRFDAISKLFAFVPAQDILGLSSSCRMNTPGIPSGNWMWKMEREGLTEALANRLALLVEKYRR